MYVYIVGLPRWGTEGRSECSVPFGFACHGIVFWELFWEWTVLWEALALSP